MSEQSRRPSHDAHDPIDVFDDEFETEDWDMSVADGFRPLQPESSVDNRRREDGRLGVEEVSHSHNNQEDDRRRAIRDHHTNNAEDPPRITSVSRHVADEDARPLLSLSRNSVRKDRNVIRNPFSSPEDDRDETNEPSLSFEPNHVDALRRSISSTSTRQFASTNSPRFGTGPSHPYAMYPQDTAASRPMSLASTSTIRPPGNSTSTRPGPQHPYTMYPQGVIEDIDDGDDEITANTLVPVGFTGLGQSYRRRGPDGEEQDIIGEFGHTEQLPPYSRYPEDGPEKTPLLVPRAPSALHSRAPVAGTDPTMPLMHTSMAPEEPRAPQSMTDASTLGRTMSRSSRSSRGSTTSFLISRHNPHKTWKEKNWSERRRTRFCGVPFWAHMIVLLVLVFVASVLGGIIGGFVSGSKRHKPSPPKYGPNTSLYDASLIPTPTNMIAPSGTWQLALSSPTEVRNGCLTDPSQVAAWSCSLGGPPAAALTICPLDDGSNRTGANIFYGSEDSQVYYGTQASYMRTNPAPLLTVLDRDSPENGPAFYFQQFYDKLVVLQESALSITPKGAQLKRDSILNPAWFEQRQVAKPGEKPWFCVWNRTSIEGYIYMQQTLAGSYETSPLTSSSSSPTASPTSGSSMAGGDYTGKTPPPDVMSSTLTFSSTTTAFVGPSSQFPSWSASVYDEQKVNKYKGFLSTLLSASQRDLEWQELSPFPYLVKLEERRLANNPYQAVCQQFQILDNQQYNPVNDDKDQPIIVNLIEQDSDYSSIQSRSGIVGSRLTKRGDKYGSCHCQWMSGQS